MNNMNVALAAVALSCLLVACGGGSTAAGDADIFSKPHPVAPGVGPLADLAVPTPRQAAARTPDATSFLNWAETAYPNYFPSAQSNKTLDVWTYRYYPQTDIYLGTNTSGDVLGLVGKGGGNYDSIPLGKITDFGCLIYPSDCGAVVSTFAGGAIGSVDGTGTAARFYGPSGVTVDSSGNVFVADTQENNVRKITPAAVVSTVAGAGFSVYGFVNGTGKGASFWSPVGVAVDSSGNVFVADRGNHAIRKITPAGVVSTFAGNGTAGFLNATRTAASFAGPSGVAVDSSGNVFVADTYNHAIRKITSEGVVSTVAGTETGDFVNGTGTAARFNSPAGVAVDSSGNVFVADTYNHAIRKITPAGVVSTFAGSSIKTLTGGTSGFVDGTGTAARFNSPASVAVDSSGNVFVADTYNHAIRKITSEGVVSTVAGNGTSGIVNGTFMAARFSYPLGVAVDSSGNVFVASGGVIRKITP